MSVLRPPIRARLTALRRHRVPVWTAGRAMLVTGVVVGLCSTLFFVADGPPAVELFVGAVFVCLMAFLTVGLYRGARVERQTAAPFRTPRVEADEGADPWAWDANLDLPGDGLLGIIVGILLWLLMTLLVLGLLAIFFNAFIWLLATVVLSVYWLFYRALRQVLIRGRRCRGNLLKSAGYAAFFTVLYTGWLLAVVLGAGVLTGSGLSG